MRPELEISHLIDRYIGNDLSIEEKSIFERRLQEDSAFREEFEMQILVNQVINGAAEQSLREKISKDISARDGRKLWTKALIVACLFLLTSASLFVWLQSTPDKPNKQDTNTVKTKSEILNTDTLVIKKDSVISDLKVQPEKVIYSTPKNDTFKFKQVIPDNIPVKEEVTKNTSSDNNAAQKEEVTLKKNDPCEKFELIINPKITGSCPDVSDGKIDFSDPNSIKGGQTPYLLSKDNGKTFKDAYIILYGLPPDKHHFIFKDANGCLHPLDLLVPAKECKTNKFAFQPETGEVWKIPALPGTSYTITIYNRSKELVFNHTSNGSDVYEWHGINLRGVLLDAGLYAYIIEYNGGKKEFGQVSIIR